MIEYEEDATSDSEADGISKKMYIEALINYVKEHPFMWDKTHLQYRCRKKVNKSWQVIATSLQKNPDEVKSKWRNLRDTFHRLWRKSAFPPTGEATSTDTCYTGSWAYFEKLIFLKENRDNQVEAEESIEEDIPALCAEDIKEEIDISEHSIASSEPSNDDKNDANEYMVDSTLPSVVQASNVVLNCVQSSPDRRKRGFPDDNIAKEPKRKLADSSPSESAIDEDLFFVKSLVPFFKKLNPIRKLIVRNEMQNLLLKEMLCSQCRSFGPQPNCPNDLGS